MLRQMSNFILCGPMVRRVDRQSVSVFVVTRRACEVTLTVFEQTLGKQGDPCAKGARKTIALGTAGGLHSVVVTAKPAAPLTWGATYLYELAFTEGGKTRGLREAGVLVPSWADAREVARLTYRGYDLPSFTLPPVDPARVRVLHGSCRKPHGEGVDALARVDTLIDEALKKPGDALRPQQLFLTGDQIYADDVHPNLLGALRTYARDAVGPGEETAHFASYGAAMEPTKRSPICTEARLTTGDKSSHLLTLGEFYAMYLHVWSPEPWGDGVAASAARQALGDFEGPLAAVRRALANIATYMIFDDHEVTDDWNLTRGWCDTVLGNPLGRRVLRNGLAAYAVFQHWGNAPEDFVVGRPGGGLLAALDGWDGTQARVGVVERLLPIPADGSALPSPAAGSIDWTWRWRGPTYDVIGLDSRTRRRFDGSGVSLLTEAGVDAALGTDVPSRFTILLAATPILGARVLEWGQKLLARISGAQVIARDVEPWVLGRSYGHLLRALLTRAPVLVLSGDVHFAFGASLFRKAAPHIRIVNFVSSALKNTPGGRDRGIVHTLHVRNDEELQAAQALEAAGLLVPTVTEVAVDDEIFVDEVHARGNALATLPEGTPETIVLQAVETRDTTDVTTLSNLGDVTLRPTDHEIVHDLWYASGGAWKKTHQTAPFWLRGDER